MSGGDNCTDEEIRACLTDSGQTDARTIVKSAAAKYASVAAQLNMLYGSLLASVGRMKEAPPEPPPTVKID